MKPSLVLILTIVTILGAHAFDWNALLDRDSAAAITNSVDDVESPKPPPVVHVAAKKSSAPATTLAPTFFAHPLTAPHAGALARLYETAPAVTE